MSKKAKVPALQKVPTNLTTDVGTASYNPATGAINATLSPELAQFRDLFWGDAMNFAPTQQQTDFANGVSNYGMNLWNQAANLDTNQMTQDYFNQQQANLQPTRALEDARLGDTLFKNGRTGAAIGYQGGGYINPEQYSLAKAREEANASMLLQAQDRARNIQQTDLANAGKYLNLGNALSLQPYENVNAVAGLGTNIASQATNLLQPLGSFSQLQQSWQQLKQQNDAARAAAKSGGLFSGLAGGILSGAANGLGSGLGSGLGDWAQTGIKAWGAANGNPAAATSLFSPSSTNYLGTNYNLGGVSYF